MFRGFSVFVFRLHLML